MKYLLLVLFVLLLISSSDGHDEISTVFKFDSLLTENGQAYQEKCTAAYVQEIDQGFPLFNITADTPLPESTIPPLYNGPNATRWQQMMNDGTTVPILVPDYANITSDYSELLSQSDSSFGYRIMDNNIRVLKEKMVKIADTDTRLFGGNDFRENSPNNQFIEVKCKVRSTIVVKLSYDLTRYLEVTLGSSEIKVCQKYRHGTVGNCHSGPGYTADEFQNFHVVLMVLNSGMYNSNLFIYDHVAGKMENSKIGIKGDLTSIFHQNATIDENYYNETTFYVHYKLIQPYPPSIIVSPWLDLRTNTSLVILYVRKPHHNISVYVEEDKTNNILNLNYRESVVKFISYNFERVLATVDVTFPENWTNQKRIKVQIENDSNSFINNIWEGRYVDLYKIHKIKKSCRKSDLNQIYDTIKLPYIRLHENPLSCYNGGSNLDKFSCLCPPGFAGEQCEIACDRNTFGHKCSKSCSTSSNECKGMVLCTSYYGCSCATGYQGERCLERCSEGYYGADCRQKCGSCDVQGCDKYTGACRGGCKTTHLIRPYCKEPYPYLRHAPRDLEYNMNSLVLEADFTASNIVGSYNNTKFYMAQYRAFKNETWNDGPYEEFHPVLTNITVDGLKPGTSYEIRVLLVDRTLETHDPPDLTRIHLGMTKCNIVEKEIKLNVKSVTNTSIYLTWNEEIDLGAKECPATSYVLEVEKTENGYLESQESDKIEGNSFEILNLSPGQTYHIKLKKNTIFGEGNPISNINVTTDDTIDLSIGISGVTVKETDSGVNVNWFKNSLYKTYYVKYKLIRRLFCSKDVIESPIQTITTSDTSCTLPDLEPKAQYQLFVTADKNQNVKAYNYTFITPNDLDNATPTAAQIEKKAKLKELCAKKS
ncbi:hypothetical protein M8J77_017308 [Diaphorina citri]|nr:hypothetical protein M8J77_017308 [Diaphorina citri]